MGSYGQVRHLSIMRGGQVRLAARHWDGVPIFRSTPIRRIFCCQRVCQSMQKTIGSTHLEVDIEQEKC
jgi:hypothetical protein